MKKVGLFRKLYRYYLLITILSLLGVTTFAFESFRRFYLDQIFQELRSKALMMRAEMLVAIDKENYDDLSRLVKELGLESMTRITVILPSGKVIADSIDNPAQMDNHADRPEFKTAIAGDTGKSTRYSFTEKKYMMYVAVPVLDAGGATRAVLRTSVSLISTRQALNSIYLNVFLGCAVLAILAAIATYLVARWLTGPIEELRKGVENFASGNFRYKLPEIGSEEIAALSTAMNKMASELDETIHTIVRQRNERDAILTGMVEGVLAVNLDQRVILMNSAAGKLLEISTEHYKNRLIQEVIRNTDIQRFVHLTLNSKEPAEAEMTIGDIDARYLQAHGAQLLDSKGKVAGAVIVIHDVTRLKRLERVRRDFVANVSHELKTPVTSIKGFVETLQSGAMNNHEEADRFLGVIARQTDRLSSIMDDLLSLSRVEQDAEKNEIVLEYTAVKDVIDAAIQASAVKAAEKNIGIDLKCDENLSIKINAPLLEQAIINLLDNAIKYSESGKKVKVDVERSDSEVTISVTDEGCGISKEHLPRLFERFYRVDKARSRKLGGTGLGLSIVKHIAIAHKGRVTVESIPSKGSIFTIHLPITTQTTKK